MVKCNKLPWFQSFSGERAAALATPPGEQTGTADRMERAPDVVQNHQHRAPSACSCKQMSAFACSLPDCPESALSGLYPWSSLDRRSVLSPTSIEGHCPVRRVEADNTRPEAANIPKPKTPRDGTLSRAPRN